MINKQVFFFCTRFELLIFCCVLVVQLNYFKLFGKVGGGPGRGGGSGEDHVT